MAVVKGAKLKENYGIKAILKETKFALIAIALCSAAVTMSIGSLVLKPKINNQKDSFAEQYKQGETYISAYDEKMEQIEKDYQFQIIDEKEYEKQKSHLDSFEYVGEVISTSGDAEVLSKYNAIVKSEKNVKILSNVGSCTNAIGQVFLATHFALLVKKKHNKKKNAIKNPPELDLPEEKENLPEADFD